MAVAAVILAAGASRRLGSPKQLAVLGGQTLLERAVDVAREAGCAPVVLVLGAEYEQVIAGCSLGDAVVAVNPDWIEGMGASIRFGVEKMLLTVSPADGVVLMTCDQPAVTAEHLRGLMKGDEARASRYAGRNGIPAYFPARFFGQLMRLQGDAGARDLLREAAYSCLAEGELDIDTMDDLERARAIFTARSAKGTTSC